MTNDESEISDESGAERGLRAELSDPTTALSALRALGTHDLRAVAAGQLPQCRMHVFRNGERVNATDPLPDTTAQIAAEQLRRRERGRALVLAAFRKLGAGELDARACVLPNGYLGLVDLSRGFAVETDLRLDRDIAEALTLPDDAGIVASMIPPGWCTLVHTDLGVQTDEIASADVSGLTDARIVAWGLQTLYGRRGAPGPLRFRLHATNAEGRREEQFPRPDAWWQRVLASTAVGPAGRIAREQIHAAIRALLTNAGAAALADELPDPASVTATSIQAARVAVSAHERDQNAQLQQRLGDEHRAARSVAARVALVNDLGREITGALVDVDLHRLQDWLSATDSPDLVIAHSYNTLLSTATAVAIYAHARDAIVAIARAFDGQPTTPHQIGLSLNPLLRGFAHAHLSPIAREHFDEHAIQDALYANGALTVDIPMPLPKHPPRRRGAGGFDDPEMADDLRELRAEWDRAQNESDTLIPRRRAYVLQASIRGWTHAQIADELGVTRGRVAQLLSRPHTARTNISDEPDA